MSFSASSVLEESWIQSKRTYWRWWPVVIVAFVVPLVLQLLATAFTGWAGEVSGFGQAILGLIGAVLSIITILVAFLFSLGILRNAYRVSGGGDPAVSDLFVLTHYWWFLAAGLIYLGIVLLGIIAFIIPGLLFAFMLVLFPYSLLSGETHNGFAALGNSWDRISGHFWRYLGLRVVLLGIPIALFVIALFFIGMAGGGIAGILSVFGSNVGSGIFATLIGLAALIALIFVYVFAVVFTYISDALAYRRLAPEHAGAPQS